MSFFKYKEFGTVISKKQCVIVVEGLANCIYGQLVDLGGGSRGMVIGFTEKHAQVLILKELTAIGAGDRVATTLEPFTTPVGTNFLGRISTSLGEPRDGKGPIKADDHYPIFRDSPPIMSRGPLERSLETGVKIIDSMIPLGCGQRELLTGDRMSGKTTIGTDTILNQKGKGVICIYVDIGKAEMQLKRATNLFQRHGCLDYTIILSAGASASQGEQYLAPYVACSLGEYFMYRGKDVFVVFDDFSKHAWAYRELSLLLGRPPGRNAYPGDIFYLHSQMIERAAQLDAKRGGGSMTFLPLMETLEGDITSYVITNLVSMTDGQICLDLKLYAQGFKPSLDLGLSVSRIGTKVQWSIMKSLTKTYRLDYLQYRELVESTKLSSDISKSVQDQLKFGAIFVELITQDKDMPVPIEEQVFIYYAHNNKMLMPLSMDQVREFKRDISPYLRENAGELLKTIRTERKLTDKIKEGMEKQLTDYLTRFIKTEEPAAAQPAGAKGTA